jgi:hypothetical protein
VGLTANKLIMEEIVNKVANSSLVQIDLASFYPQGKRTTFDLKPWLFEELILKEKDFRDHVSNHDWSQYKDQYVSIICSADVIIPSCIFTNFYCIRTLCKGFGLWKSRSFRNRFI